MPSECVKTITLAPLTGPLDTRSLPSEVSFGSWRWRQNVDALSSGKASRRKGFQKLIPSAAIYNNQDLHDQLIVSPTEGCTGSVNVGSGVRQPITTLFEVVSTTGVRRLLAATQNRVYCSRFTKGNWKLISDSFGGDAQSGLPERRWECAQVNDAVILTNNHDAPKKWLIDQPDQPNTGCATVDISDIDSLSEIGLTRASTIYSWKGIILLGDVIMDGQSIPHRVVWSDLNAPTSFTPANDSIAGFQDLGYGERIIKMMEMGDYLLIYTNKSIWQVSVIGGASVFNFRQAYSQPESGEACLAFPNTLASSGQDHYFLGRDGVYNFNLFLPKPERVAWMHLGSSEIFNTISFTTCLGHTACYHQPSKEYRVSWVETSSALPQRTIAFNLEYQHADIIDFGFTAALNHAPDLRPDIDVEVLGKCFCTEADLALLADFISPSIKEGTPCVSPAASGCTTNTTSSFTTERMEGSGGQEIENYWDTSPDGELCAYLNSLDLEAECRECSVDALLVFASASDYCLKQDGGVYYREFCTAFTACGAYRRDGYSSIMRSGPIAFRAPSDIKEIKQLDVEFYAETQTTPNDLNLRIGVSATAADSNSGGAGCGVVWRNMNPKSLACPLTGIAGTTPASTVNWPMWFQARNLYFELRVNGTGGGAAFSAIHLQIGGRAKCPEV